MCMNKIIKDCIDPKKDIISFKAYKFQIVNGIIVWKKFSMIKYIENNLISYFIDTMICMIYSILEHKKSLK